MLNISALFLVASLCGICGACNQTYRQGWCTGRKLLSCYQCIMIIVVGIFLAGTIYIQIGYSALTIVSQNLSQGQPSEYSRIEKYMASIFNDLYFDGLTSRGTSNTMGWFYSPLLDICGSNSEINPYSCTSCPDETVCYSFETVESTSCPWDMCRLDLAEYLVEEFPIYKFYLLMVACGVSAFICNACMLICYNPAKRPNILLAAQMSKAGRNSDLRGSYVGGNNPMSSQNPPPKGKKGNAVTQQIVIGKMKSPSSGSAPVSMRVPRGFEKLSKKDQIAYLQRLRQLHEESSTTNNPLPTRSLPTPPTSASDSQANNRGQRLQQPQQLLNL